MAKKDKVSKALSLAMRHRSRLWMDKMVVPKALLNGGLTDSVVEILTQHTACGRASGYQMIGTAEQEFSCSCAIVALSCFLLILRSENIGGKSWS